MLRALRSLSWGDEGYAGNVLGVLRQIAEADPEAFQVIEQFVHQKHPGESEYVSAKPAERRITFAPNVFSVPEMSLEPDLAVVMMPFSAEFSLVYTSIRNARKAADLRCLMYETGIAHTLGKPVVPISQSPSDDPFDLTHHRI